MLGLGEAPLTPGEANRANAIGRLAAFRARLSATGPQTGRHREVSMTEAVEQSGIRKVCLRRLPIALLTYSFTYIE